MMMEWRWVNSELRSDSGYKYTSTIKRKVSSQRQVRRTLVAACGIQGEGLVELLTLQRRPRGYPVTPDTGHRYPTPTSAILSEYKHPPTIFPAGRQLPWAVAPRSRGCLVIIVMFNE